MPPKKKVEEQPKVLLGRPGNSLKSGIVGLANVGKSTLFQAITKCDLGNPANFPFATINPEEARCLVPDERFEWLCEKYQPKSKVPANLTVYDIAGLTRGAHNGDGLGNEFLSHIRAVDAIFQVVRGFEDPEVTHIELSVDPVRDLAIIYDELRRKDIAFIDKAIEIQAKKARSTGGNDLDRAKTKEDLATMEEIKKLLEEGKPVKRVIKEPKKPDREEVVLEDEIDTHGRRTKLGPGKYQQVPVRVHHVRTGDWDPKQVELINTLNLLTAKPIVHLCNISEDDYVAGNFKGIARASRWIKARFPEDPVVPVSVAFEERLARMSEEDAKKVCEELKTTSALPKIIIKMREVLHLISFFTVGRDEVRQWTLRLGAKAPAAGGLIHSDYEERFNGAHVYTYSHLREFGDEVKVKANGKTKSAGSEYVMEDGDIIHFAKPKPLAK